MYQPITYAIALSFMLCTMLCWGSWANTVKLAPGFRFQLFYWDYVIGLFAGALLWGFTLGSFGSSGLRGGRIGGRHPVQHDSSTCHHHDASQRPDQAPRLRQGTRRRFQGRSGKGGHGGRRLDPLHVRRKAGNGWRNTGLGRWLAQGNVPKAKAAALLEEDGKVFDAAAAALDGARLELDQAALFQLL